LAVLSLLADGLWHCDTRLNTQHNPGTVGDVRLGAATFKGSTARS
jgi:hypothetical protein